MQVANKGDYALEDAQKKGLAVQLIDAQGHVLALAGGIILILTWIQKRV